MERQKNSVGSISLINFNIYYIAIMIKSMCYLHIHRSVKQNKVTRNRPTEIWPTDFSQKNSMEESNSMEERAFSTNVLRELDTYGEKRILTSQFP